MKRDTAGSNERARRLMMAALDGESSSAERTELERVLAADPSLREEWDRLSMVKEVTETMKLKDPPEEVWDHYWHQTYNRFERGAAWTLVSLGGIVAIGYAIWEMMGAMLAETDLPGFVKFAIFAAALGGTILFVSVVREKLLTGRADPYKGIQR